MNTSNNKRKKESQRRIAGVFIDLMQTREVHEISVTEICKLAGVNRTTFYANYLDIYDLADKVLHGLMGQVNGIYSEELTRHYRSLNSWLREAYGGKVYKLALDGGFTCPTRDGTKGKSGCIFCAGGSGDFSIPIDGNVEEAIETAKAIVDGKGAEKYIAYFQSYTGTYAPLEQLRALYMRTIEHPDIVALSIGTRPDCLGEDVLDLLSELNATKPVWVELGLQTIHPETAEYIRRGYPLHVFDDAVTKLLERNLTVVAHMIIGLPGETPEMIRETAEYIGKSGAQGIKFQLLHVLEGTDLAKDYRDGKFQTLSLEEYIRILESCVESIPPEMVIHRLTGDGAKRSLIAPLWSGDKKRVLNEINSAFDRDQIMQGNRLTKEGK